MTRVLSFVNTFSSSSIPVEIADKVASTTDVDVTVASFYAPARVDPDLESLACEYEFLEGSHRFDAGAFRRLARRCERSSFDVLHTHHNFSGAVGRLVGRWSDVAVVDTEHNDHRHFSLLQNLVNASTIRLADVVVANSMSTLDSFRWYERGQLGAEASIVIHNGVDIERVERARAESSRPDLPSGPLVTTVGSLTEQKAQGTLIRALPAIRRRHPGATLVVVGEGPRRGKLERTSRREGVGEHVHFTGYLPTREDVYGVLEASDVFALSSRYEGFCVAALEAMACGLPVVVSDIEVLHEVVGEQGRFAAVGSPASFFEEIASLLENEAERDRLGRGLERRARSEFPLERTAREYADLYHDLAT